jgi:hypothetical protein
MTLGAEMSEYLACVSSATHRKVDVDAVGLDCKGLDALVEHYGYVVCFGCHFWDLLQSKNNTALRYENFAN